MDQQAERRSTAYYVRILALLVLLVEITGLTYWMVTPALTAISEEYHTANIGWVVTAVTLVGAVTYALFGKLGDLFGKKKIAVTVTVIFALGAVLSAVAPSMGVMIAGRALQGAGITALALVYGLIRDLFPKRLVPIALGFVGAGFGASPIIGPPIAGFLIDNYSFRGVFWFLAVYSIAIAVLIATTVPESEVRIRARMDWAGVTLLGIGAVALLVGVGNAGTSGWLAPATLAPTIGGVLVLVLWIVYERRPSDPLIDPRLLKRRRISATMTTSFFVQFALVGNSLLLPLFVMAPTRQGYGFGVTATGAAMFVLVSGLSGLVAGVLAGFAARRVGPRVTLSVGVAGIAIGGALMALLHANPTQVVVAQLVFGIGLGACSASMSNMIVQSVPAEVQGVSGGMLNLFGSLGSSIGSQLMVVVLLIPVAVYVEGTVVYGELGFTIAYLLLAGAGVVGMLAMACAGRATGPQHPETPDHTPSQEAVGAG